MSHNSLLLAISLFALSLAPALAAPPITAAALSPDAKHVLVASQAGIVVLASADLAKTGSISTEFEQIHDLQFSPDGTKLLVAGGTPGESGSVAVLSWPGRETLQRIAAHTDVVYRVAWSPSGAEFATASADSSCRIFAAQSGKERVRYTGHSQAVLTIAYLPDGASLISAGVDQTLQLWSGASGERIRGLDNHLGPVNDLAVRPAANQATPPVVVSISEDRTVRIWQPTIGRLLRFAKLDSVPRCVAWAAAGNRILVGCNDGHVRWINPDTVELEHSAPAIQGRLHTLLGGPEDQWLAGGEQGEIRWLKNPAPK